MKGRLLCGGHAQGLFPSPTIALEAVPHELRTTVAEPDLRILWGKDLKLPSADGEL